MKKDRIFLIGFMGSGKSTVAACLQSMCGIRAVEMDREIEEQQGMAISDIFREKGEAFFRELETGFLRGLREEHDIVVSCGGGAAMREENVREMRSQGVIVFLSASPETIYERVKNSSTRPLLEGNMNVEYIRSLLEKRLPAYQAAADLTVTTDNRDIPGICRAILELLKTGNV